MEGVPDPNGARPTRISPVPVGVRVSGGDWPWSVSSASRPSMLAPVVHFPAEQADLGLAASLYPASK